MDKKISTRDDKNSKFMNASILNFQIILVAQIWIYPPLPLMIEPARIKEPAIPQIWPQLPYLLPLKIMLVILPTLMIRHDSFSCLLIILTLPMQWINMILTVSGWKEDTALGKMIKKVLQKDGREENTSINWTTNHIKFMLHEEIPHLCIIPGKSIKEIKFLALIRSRGAI